MLQANWLVPSWFATRDLIHWAHLCICQENFVVSASSMASGSQLNITICFKPTGKKKTHKSLRREAMDMMPVPVAVTAWYPTQVKVTVARHLPSITPPVDLVLSNREPSKCAQVSTQPGQSHSPGWFKLGMEGVIIHSWQLIYLICGTFLRLSLINQSINQSINQNFSCANIPGEGQAQWHTKQISVQKPNPGFNSETSTDNQVCRHLRRESQIKGMCLQMSSGSCCWRADQTKTGAYSTDWGCKNEKYLHQCWS